MLVSHDQTGHNQFLPSPPKKCFDELLIFVNLYQHAKNQFFHLLILQIQSILEPRHQTGNTYFSPCQPKQFSSNF